MRAPGLLAGRPLWSGAFFPPPRRWGADLIVAVPVFPLLPHHVVVLVAVAVLPPHQARRPAVRMVLPPPARHVPDRPGHIARLDHAERAAIGARAVPVALVPDEPVDAVAEEVVIAIVVVQH